MIAAFGTLAFLATLWLLVVVGAAVLEESGAKIAAALKGKPPQPSPSVRPGPGADPRRGRSSLCARPRVARRRLTRA